MVKVIEREKPDGIFAAFGGQTALNCAVKMSPGTDELATMDTCRLLFQGVGGTI